MGYPARIEVELSSGEVLTRTAGVVRGRFENPMPYDEVEEKSASLLRDCRLDPDPLLAAMRRLPEADTVDELMAVAALSAGSVGR